MEEYAILRVHTDLINKTIACCSMSHIHLEGCSQLERLSMLESTVDCPLGTSVWNSGNCHACNSGFSDQF
jgi:hypothetical protein